MFRKAGKQISPAMIVALVALVFAMSGGAYALTGSNGHAPQGKTTASNAKSNKKKKDKSMTKGARGPAGPRGPEGAQGPAGPAGPAGLKGEAGAAGKDGSNGTNGTNGVGATTEAFTGNQHGCEEGGVLIKSASPEAAVCNGSAAKAAAGLPERLPAGSTETGTWSNTGVNPNHEEITEWPSLASYTIPLTTAPAVAIIGLQEGLGELHEKLPAGCTGNYSEPEAEPGHLCVYTAEQYGVEIDPYSETRSYTSGAIAPAYVESGAKEWRAYGTWAVTAE